MNFYIHTHTVWESDSDRCVHRMVTYGWHTTAGINTQTQQNLSLPLPVPSKCTPVIDTLLEPSANYSHTHTHTYSILMLSAQMTKHCLLSVVFPLCVLPASVEMDRECVSNTSHSFSSSEPQIHGGMTSWNLLLSLKPPIISPGNVH